MQLLPRPERNGQPIHSDQSDFDTSEDRYPFEVLSPVYHPDPLPLNGHHHAKLQTLHSRHRDDHLHQRLAIFIDGANLLHAALQLEFEIDYIKLLKCLTGDRQLLRAYFYTGVHPQNQKQQNFLHWMRCNGYRVIAKELIQHQDGSKKANLDVEMAVDMLMLTEYCDTFVLLSGTGALAYAIDKVTYKGVQMEVVSLPAMTSDLLIDFADRYINLETLIPSIRRDA
ncbi:MAG: NYN domain-containing protein [Cyanothece sp. SIO2G6]|nr:NYN domain-containing protein [Cyanothece sp. SIO2G6]